MTNIESATAHRDRSRSGAVSFVVVSLAVFYGLVFGLPLNGTALPAIRSAALVAYAMVFVTLQDRFVPFEPVLVERHRGGWSVALWGAACFAVNLILVGGSFYLFFRGFVNDLNRGFGIERFSGKPIAVRIAMAFAAAFSEEVVYRRILFRYLLGPRSPGFAGCALASVTSALVFGFGHFHAGFEKCVVASVSGLVFAGFYVWKKNIWIVVVGHFLGDALAFVI